MSILIKGMEMPLEKNLVIQIYPEGTVRRLDGSIYNSHFEAVPIPPHGRLIDADVLSQMFDPDESFGAAVLEIIADTPTIIPAEEGE